MKKFIVGIIVGILLFAFFVFFGGGDYLKKLAARTDKAGSEVVNYEKQLKKQVQSVRQKAGKVKDAATEAAREKKDEIKKKVME